MRKLMALVALVTVVALTAVGIVTATTRVTTTITHAATLPPGLHRGLEVTQTTMVLDGAGARCASSSDVNACHHERLYPVHPPVGTATFHARYAPNSFGQEAVVASSDPALAIGTLLPQHVRLGAGHGAAFPDHSFYSQVNWKHFPCFCTYGKILQDIEVHAFVICTITGGCPVHLGPVQGYTPSYIQQIYGLFSQGFRTTVAYATASYEQGADYNLGGHPSTGHFDAGGGPSSGFRYGDNKVFGFTGCGTSIGVGVANFAGDQMFTFHGDYTEAGWIDEFPWNCVLGFPNISDGTHMA